MKIENGIEIEIEKRQAPSATIKSESREDARFDSKHFETARCALCALVLVRRSQKRYTACYKSSSCSCCSSAARRPGPAPCTASTHSVHTESFVLLIVQLLPRPWPKPSSAEEPCVVKQRGTARVKRTRRRGSRRLPSSRRG